MRKWCVWGHMVLLAILFLFCIPSILETWHWKAFHVSGDGMKPTFSKGDYVFVNRKKPLEVPQRFDLAAFHADTSDGPPIVYVQRIVGLPSETISIVRNRIHINGEELVFPEAIRTYFTNVCSFVPQHATCALGSDEYYLIGDNVAFSADSRYLGPVAFSRFVGYATSATMDDYPLRYGLGGYCLLLLILLMLISLYPFNLLKTEFPLRRWIPVTAIGTGIATVFLVRTMAGSYLNFSLILAVILYAWVLRHFISRWLRKRDSQSTGRLIQLFSITSVGLLLILFWCYRVWAEYGHTAFGK